MIKIRFGSAVALAVLLVGLLQGSSVADLAKDQDMKSQVTQYLSIQYSTQRCDGYWAYKMNSISRRWHRDVTNRKVRAEGYYGYSGEKCNGDNVQSSHHFELAPCFGCDGYSAGWTPDYIAFPSHPFTHCRNTCLWNPQDPDDWSGGSILGINMRGTIRNNGGDFLASICTKISLYGATSCIN